MVKKSEIYGGYSKVPRRRRDGSDKKRRRTGGVNFMAMLDAVVIVVTVGNAVLLLLGYLAPRVNPNSLVVFAFLGLAVPVLLIINFAALLYWTMRWKKLVILPLAVLVLGLGKVALIFQPSLGKHYNGEREKGALTIVTHNAHGFLSMDGSGVYLDQTLELLSSLTPDIVCLQEYQITPQITQQRADELLSALPFRSVCFKMQYDADTGFGMAVYSRYPIIRSDFINFEQHNGSFMWADVVCRRDTLRVFNCHFQTTSIDASDREFVTSAEFMQQDAVDNKRRMRSILSKLAQNFRIRATQADTIARVIHSSPHDVVVCGDFNDTPVSYTYRRIRGPLADSFVDKGTGRTNTYRGFFNLFRIDYILHSRNYRTLLYAEPPTQWSDHNPVVTTIKKD